ASFFELHTYDLKNNLAARWGLFWAIFFVSITVLGHCTHDYIHIYHPEMHFIYWIIGLLPLIFYPLVGATGTLEVKENLETTQKLKWSNIRYKTLVDNLPQIVYSASPENKFDIKFISPHIDTFCGYKEEEFYSSPETFKKIIHPDDREDIINKAKNINQNILLNYRIIHKDSNKRYYVIDHSIPVKEDNKIIAIDGIIVDITNEIRAKQRLEALARELINTQEKERQRIAKELHDELGQALSTIKINLSLLEKNLDSDSSKAEATIKQTYNILDMLILDLKRISLDLRPSMLDDLGLDTTLQWYIKEFKERTKMEVEYSISGIKKRLPSNTEIALYRIVQEALTNIVKHSSANKVKISIRKDKKNIKVNIEDNGRGFSVENAFNPETRGISFGIMGMQERVKDLGGDFKITSKETKGTTLSLSVPFGSLTDEKSSVYRTVTNHK
ncbi:PAS domain-containing protein, partial [bacterium]|nr:PAS domain-containing protein [bacterium]